MNNGSYLEVEVSSLDLSVCLIDPHLLAGLPTLVSWASQPQISDGGVLLLTSAITTVAFSGVENMLPITPVLGAGGTVDRIQVGVQDGSFEVVFVNTDGDLMVGIRVDELELDLQILRFLVAGQPIGNMPPTSIPYKGTLTGLSVVSSAPAFNPLIHTGKLWYTDDSLYFGLASGFLRL